DLILLDIGLPERDGFSLCAALRKSVDAPIIFVTSRDSSLDEIQALSLGGDDYITKPYNIPVLMARIKTALRRKKNTSEADILEIKGLEVKKPGTVALETIKAETGKTEAMKVETTEQETVNLRLNLTKGTISAGPKTILLTRNELQILACLMNHPGEIVSRTELIETLWDNQIYIDDNTLSVNMTRLRGKLEELGLPDLIKTRRGMGYQL
ncbi:MAG: response regulator transcription factor, partial [Acetatifactor sp.]|nr:response regulator transcription factor [Acetatifactor sp.]